MTQGILRCRVTVLTRRRLRSLGRFSANNPQTSRKLGQAGSLINVLQKYGQGEECSIINEVIHDYNNNAFYLSLHATQFLNPSRLINSVQHDSPGCPPAVPGPPGPVPIPDKQRPLPVPVAGPHQVKVPSTEGIPRPLPSKGQGRH